MTKKAPYKGLGADSEEKREPASDIDTAAADSLKVLDPKRPIREADVELAYWHLARIGGVRGVMDPSIAKCNNAKQPVREKRNKTSGHGVTDQRIVIAQLNIDHFRKKRAAEQNAEKRATLQRLLAEEEAKLAALKKESGGPSTDHKN